MAYNLFQRRSRNDGAETQFAETELSRPAPAETQAPHGATGPSQVDSLPAGPHTDLGLDTQPAPAAEWAVADSPTTAHIGRYALKGLLGSGSQGQVHEAWDPLLSRTVAVKTLLRAPDTPRRVALDALWLKEAQTAAGLVHPYIVSVYEAGLSAHGVYIAMERLRGSDLRLRLTEGWRPTAAQAALMVRRLADALAHAHGCGVLHGGIKPANIFLNRRDQPKLLDFGLARGALRAQPIDAGSGAGSPPDVRTDIHALGQVLQELLALRPATPPPLAAIAARATATEPAERHATALELAHDLRRWLERDKAADPTVLESARPRVHAPGDRRRRPARLRLRTALGVTALALLIGAGVALAIWGPLRQDDRERRGEAAAAPSLRGLPVAP